MDDMTKRQPDVERVTKAFQSKRQPQQQAPPAKEKGRERHESDRRSGRGTPSIPKTPVYGFICIISFFLEIKFLCKIISIQL